MKNLTLLIALVALLAVPALASGQGRHLHRGHAAIAAARSACQSELDADQAAFTAKYANKNGRRAMRRCIVRHVVQATRTCREERKSDRAAFRTKYGNENGRQAFRRCVVQHSGDSVA